MLFLEETHLVLTTISTIINPQLDETDGEQRLVDVFFFFFVSSTRYLSQTRVDQRQAPLCMDWVFGPVSQPRGSNENGFLAPAVLFLAVASSSSANTTQIVYWEYKIGVAIAAAVDPCSRAEPWSFLSVVCT